MSVEYARASDGVHIAYRAIGSGPAFVYMPNLPYSHCEIEWQFSPTRSFYERLGRRRRFVRYDGRGAGLSDRDVTDFSLDAQMRDLDAVVDHLGLGAFTLLGPYHMAPVAIAFAALHPERVSALILWCGYEKGTHYIESPQVVATRELIDKDWNLYTETNAHLVFGWSQGPRAQAFAQFMRDCVEPEVVKASYAAFREFDVTPYLEQVRAPTLVLHRRDLPWLSLSVARNLAACIHDAQLLLLDGDSGVLYTEPEVVAGAIDEFLGDAGTGSSK